MFNKLQKRNGTKEKHFSLNQSSDELKKLLLENEKQIKRQGIELTDTIQLATQVGTIYNWYSYKI